MTALYITSNPREGARHNEISLDHVVLPQTLWCAPWAPPLPLSLPCSSFSPAPLDETRNLTDRWTVGALQEKIASSSWLGLDSNDHFLLRMLSSSDSRATRGFGQTVKSGLLD